MSSPTTPHVAAEVETKASFLTAEKVGDLFPIFETQYMGTALQEAIPSDYYKTALPRWFSELHIALEADNKNDSTLALIHALKQVKDLEKENAQLSAKNNYWLDTNTAERKKYKAQTNELNKLKLKLLNIEKEKEKAKAEADAGAADDADKENGEGEGKKKPGAGKTCLKKAATPTKKAIQAGAEKKAGAKRASDRPAQEQATPKKQKKE